MTSSQNAPGGQTPLWAHFLFHGKGSRDVSKPGKDRPIGIGARAKTFLPSGVYRLAGSGRAVTFPAMQSAIECTGGLGFVLCFVMD